MIIVVKANNLIKRLYLVIEVCMKCFGTQFVLQKMEGGMYLKIFLSLPICATGLSIGFHSHSECVFYISESVVALSM